jgi:FkbM family methyltransferase
MLLRPGDTYFELGGGVGFVSTLAARIVRDPSRVHVYEANPELIPTIERTWAANGVGGSVYNCMLGTGKGEHKFYVSQAFWASSGQIDYGRSRVIMVPQRDFLKQLEFKEATFVLMNIEGGEGELLIRTLPARVRVVVAEFHPRIIGQATVEALWANSGAGLPAREAGQHADGQGVRALAGGVAPVTGALPVRPRGLPSR